MQVPPSESPFVSPDDLNVFQIALAAVGSEDIVPEGYGLLEDEWEEDAYSTIEVINSGRRGRREIVVGLPEHVWRPRAVLWEQALDVLIRVLHM